MNYDPNCSHCRREAGKPPAGIPEDWLCYGHTQADRDRLLVRAERERRHRKWALKRARKRLHLFEKALDRLIPAERSREQAMRRVRELEAEVQTAIIKIEKGDTYDAMETLWAALRGGEEA